MEFCVGRPLDVGLPRLRVVRLASAGLDLATTSPPYPRDLLVANSGAERGRSVHAMHVDIEPLDPADTATVELWFALQVAASRADIPDFPDPSRGDLVDGLRHPWPARSTEHWVACDDAGRVVGSVQIELPHLDNTDNAIVELVVHPEQRRRGVGRALFDHALRRAKEVGRKRLLSHSCEPLPGGPLRDEAGTAFATAVGAKPALREVRRRLDLSIVDDAALVGRLADAWRQAAGYSLVCWRDRTPDDVVDDIAMLDSRLVLDAPMGELVVEAPKIDAARFRAAERVHAARGHREYHAAVRHDATGQTVGWSGMTLMDNAPHHAWQGITIVHPDHRGHRLGTIVKLENLAYARRHEPGLREIDTWNAAVNDHMIGINEMMGFRPVDTWVNWQLTL